MFVFDNAQGKDELLKLVQGPPVATGGFYSQKKKHRPLDQVIGVPYFADSRHVGLIQVADLFALILRLYADLIDSLADEEFSGELQRIRDCIDIIRPVLLSDASRWPKTSKEPFTEFLRTVAPDSLLSVSS